MVRGQTWIFDPAQSGSVLQKYKAIISLPTPILLLQVLLERLSLYFFGQDSLYLTTLDGKNLNFLQV